MREVKAPLEPQKSKELQKVGEKNNKFGKFIITSGALVGMIFLAKKLITKFSTKNSRFKVYKVLKT